MAIATTKTICFVCNKCKITYVCPGCSQQFCLDHLPEHRKNLSQQLEQIQNDHDQLRQELNDRKIDSTSHPLIAQIDQWERNSIEQIQRTAQQCKQNYINYSNTFLLEVENKLNNVAEQIIEIYKENEFSEIDLKHLKQKLDSLQKHLYQSENLSIRQQSTSLINNISLEKSK